MQYQVLLHPTAHQHKRSHRRETKLKTYAPERERINEQYDYRGCRQSVHAHRMAVEEPAQLQHGDHQGTTHDRRTKTRDESVCP